MKVYYIGFFDFQNNNKKREVVVSATNKMEYIVSVLNDCGLEVEMISLALSRDSLYSFYMPEHRVISPLFKVNYFASLGIGKKLYRLRKKYRNWCLKKYILSHVTERDLVIVYHSTSDANQIVYNCSKKIGFKYVLEVEEIYSDIEVNNSKLRVREYDIFNKVDGFIFSTDALNEKLNTNNRPAVTINGTYDVAPILSSHLTEDVHIVYAGTFDPRKGGAQAAIASAEYLSSKYHIHICGFGTPCNVDSVKKQIMSMKSSKKDIASITYEGLLTGNNYLKLLQSCHIGLSTQNNRNAFNQTSFPSKILSYMANGLRVVSTRVKAVEDSSVGTYLYYSKSESPEDIANAILSINLNDGYDGRKIISDLDIEFKRNIYNMLTSI